MASAFSTLITFAFGVYISIFVLEYETQLNSIALWLDLIMLKIRGYYYDSLHDCVVEWKHPKKLPSGEIQQSGICRQSFSVFLKMIFCVFLETRCSNTSVWYS